ncbi:pyruvate kinase [Nanobdella aerobiophila]|uniref:Pyruvate kinase n=1 Tax=Nanobdella aerobiophila TaxID=2586965 RepID=A0A915SF88_9ARCH|nr:pyruvate kinase [Nanobdella aerobiophila]BBL45555.1 pyruvate kinase [Nanobdella aerobiophila]
MKNTKIIATIGPSTIDKIKDIDKYVDIYRINFSHGDKKSHKEYFDKIRENSEKPILVDLPGPKIRIGNIKDKIILKKGDKIIFSQNDGVPVEEEIFYNIVKPGTDIYLSDGDIKVHIDKVEDHKVEGTILDGGILTSKKGINIPDINLPSGITKKDIELLKDGLKLGADYFGLSFILNKDDILKVKDIVKDRAWIISKIETQKAMNDLEEIIKVSDGVMVARGDLGVDIGFTNLIFAQKRIIELSRTYGKPVILATHVLESMVNNSVPTRAEIIDASNSVLEGVDAIMLSDETAIGNNPIDAIEMLNDIIVNVEKNIKSIRPPINDYNDSIALATIDAAEISKSKLIIVYSRTGSSIIRISRLRPSINIIGLTPNKNLLKKLNILYGVYPILEDRNLSSISEIVDYCRKLSKEYIDRGNIIIVGGDPKSKLGKTDFLKIEEID